MRRVELTSRTWVQPTAETRGHWQANEPIVAKFHQFGSAYEEFESGPGNYTVAIIEMADGTIQSVPPTDIRFVD